MWTTKDMMVCHKHLSTTLTERLFTTMIALIIPMETAIRNVLLMCLDILLLQWKTPLNHPLIREALRLSGREDLIGFGPQCLVPPRELQGGRGGAPARYNRDSQPTPARRNGERPVSQPYAERAQGRRSGAASAAGTKPADRPPVPRDWQGTRNAQPTYGVKPAGSNPRTLGRNAPRSAPRKGRP